MTCGREGFHDTSLTYIANEWERGNSLNNPYTRCGNRRWKKNKKGCRGCGKCNKNWWDWKKNGQRHVKPWSEINWNDQPDVYRGIKTPKCSRR